MAPVEDNSPSMENLKAKIRAISTVESTVGPAEEEKTRQPSEDSGVYPI